VKKLWLILGLTFMLLAGGGKVYQIFEINPAFGQPPPPYNNPYYYPPPSNYYNYYSAPYTDPLSQFLYYVVPQIGGQEYYVPPQGYYVAPRREGHEEFEEQEHRGREGYEHRGRGREDH
jgi:hypothetical protein